MSDDITAISRLIEELDHPDAHRQDDILAQFDTQPDRVRPQVMAHLPLVNGRVRRALLRWLGRHLAPSITLGLMRYVFDFREAIDEQTGREMAMAMLVRRGSDPADPKEIGRLRGFAEDMVADSNPAIRRLALILLSHVGNLRSAALAQRAKADDDPQVRKAADKALAILAEAPDEPGRQDPVLDAPTLAKRLINAAGPLRQQLIRRWRRHDERAPIALSLLRQHSALPLREIALQILIERPDPAARSYLAGLILDEPNQSLPALALRLLAKLASDAPPGPDERRAIRQALHHSDDLIQIAAIDAAAAFSMAETIPHIIKLSTVADLGKSLAAARALTILLGPNDHHRCAALVDALQVAERRRRTGKTHADPIHRVAHLIQALTQVISPQTVGLVSARRTVLGILRAGADHRPLRVTGLTFLLAATPEAGLDEYDRWAGDEIDPLIALLATEDREQIKRVATLLIRVAPKEQRSLEAGARQIWQSSAVDCAQFVVPLAARADRRPEADLLSEIAASKDPAAADAAAQVLRRRRNKEDFIDVDFVPDD